MINNNLWVSHSHVVILRLLFLGEKDMETQKRVKKWENPVTRGKPL